MRAIAKILALALESIRVVTAHTPVCNEMARAA
jgi:hypothetical protein